MISAPFARRVAVSFLLSLIGCSASHSQTITRLTDQVLQIHRSSSPDSFINLSAEKVLFTASPDGISERRPFVTNGTASGTLALLPNASAGTTVIGGFHLLGSHAYFFTYTPNPSGYSFWKTDGTPGGTTIVTDEAPTDVRLVGVVNGRLVAIGSNYPLDFLWASDGTPQGTGPIFIPPVNTWINSGTVVSGTYYLGLHIETENGRRDAIWKSDGTNAGTVEVKTLSHQDGGTTRFDFNPDQFIAFNDATYFLARETVFSPGLNDYYDRSVLWKTGGTSATTQRLGAFEDLYQRMFTFSGSLYLERSGSVQYDGSVARPRVLRSNGTIAGSSIVFYGNTPQNYTGLTRMGEHNGQIFYNATNYNVLYPTDPIYSDILRMLPDGTFEKISILPNGYAFPRDLLTSGYGLRSRPGAFYFASYGGLEDIWRINDGLYPTVERLGRGTVVSGATLNGHMIGAGDNFTAGIELYSSQNGHTLIADLSPGFDQNDASYSGVAGGARATLGNLLLYAGQDPVNGMELWRSDGTVQDTFLLKDISFGAKSSSINTILPANGFAWFTILRGDIGPEYTVNELWKTDGTPEGTVFVKRCPDTDYWSELKSDGSRIVVKKTSNEDSTTSFEILDGPGAGTTIPTSATGSNWYLAGGSIWWTENYSPNTTIKRHDGSSGHTRVIPAGQTLYEFAGSYGDGVICLTYTQGSSYQYHVVWVRPSGNVILRTTSNYPAIYGAKELNGRLYFIDDDSLFSSDGTPGSAVLLHRASQMGINSEKGYVVHRGSLYFLSRPDYDSPLTVWKTNGTPETTSQTPITFPQGISDAYLVSNGDWLLYPYTYYDSGLGQYISQARYSSGATDGATIPNMTAEDLSFHQYEKYLTPHPAGVVFFSRQTTETGTELYKLELPSAPPTTSFGIWAENNGLTGPAAAPTVDADNDGVPNLVEFFSGTQPNQSSSSPKPAFSTINVSGAPTKVISIPRMPETGLTLAVETSVNLADWSRDVTVAPNGTATVAPGSRIAVHSRNGSSPETITFAVNPPGAYPKMFVRFRVEE